MAQLSDEELREAAQEAGISPHELRHALAERDGSALARPEEATSLMGPSTRGESASFVEGRIAKPPDAALAAVRSSIERQTGKSGHRQGESEVDIVDDSLGLNYQLRTSEDGGGGALVRVDVDPTSGRSFRNLAAAATMGVTLAIVGLAMLISSTMIGVAGMGLGVFGGLMIIRRSARLAQGIANAHAISAQALMEAEDSAPAQGMLPPST